MGALAGLFQSARKFLDPSKALLWVFRKGLEEHLLYGTRETLDFPIQWSRRGDKVLGSYLHWRPMKGPVSAQPFIEHNAQGILITGGTGSAVDLLRGHIRKGTGQLLRRLRSSALVR